MTEFHWIDETAGVPEVTIAIGFKSREDAFLAIPELVDFPDEWVETYDPTVVKDATPRYLETRCTVGNVFYLPVSADPDDAEELTHTMWGLRLLQWVQRNQVSQPEDGDLDFGPIEMTFVFIETTTITYDSEPEESPRPEPPAPPAPNKFGVN